MAQRPSLAEEYDHVLNRPNSLKYPFFRNPKPQIWSAYNAVTFFQKRFIGIKIIFRLEMRLEPVPLQLEHVATNQSCNHHSIYLEGWNGGCHFSL